MFRSVDLFFLKRLPTAVCLDRGSIAKILLSLSQTFKVDPQLSIIVSYTKYYVYHSECAWAASRAMIGSCYSLQAVVRRLAARGGSDTYHPTEKPRWIWSAISTLSWDESKDARAFVATTVSYWEVTVPAKLMIVEKFPMSIRFTWGKEIWYSKRLCVIVPTVKSLRLWATHWASTEGKKSKRAVVCET